MRPPAADVSGWARCFGRSAMLIVLFVLSIGMSGTAAASIPSTQTTTLGNGLTVVSQTRGDSPTVSVAVAVRAGVRDETPDFWGGAHWLEHLIFLGGERYPSSAAVFGAISDLGGQIDARTGPEATTFAVTAPAPSLPAVLDVLADMLINSRFPRDEDEVERERQTVLTELEGDALGSFRTTIDTFAEHLIGRVALSTGGTASSVAALDLDDAIAFKAQRYVARNMVVGVIGPVSHADAVAAISQTFAALPGGERRFTPLPPPEGSGRLPGSGLPVFVGQRIPGFDSPDETALRVLDAILDVPGTRMADAIDRGETTFAGGTLYRSFSDAGAWIAYGGGNADEVMDIVRTQIRRLQDDLVSPEELRAATRFLAGRVLIDNELGLDQAVRLAERSLFGSYATEQEEANRILAVSADDIRRVARAYFDPDTFSVMRLEREHVGSNASR